MGPFVWDIDPASGVGLLKAPQPHKHSDWRALLTKLDEMGYALDTVERFWFQIGADSFYRMLPKSTPEGLP